MISLLDLRKDLKSENYIKQSVFENTYSLYLGLGNDAYNDVFCNYCYHRSFNFLEISNNSF